MTKQNVFSASIIKPDSFLLALKRLELVHQSDTQNPRGLMVLGEAGSGKTTLVQYFRDTLVSKDTALVSPQKALYFSVPPNISMDSFFSSALEAAGDPAPTLGKLDKKKERLLNYMHELGVEVVIVDEFHEMLPQKGEVDHRSKGVKFVKWVMNTAKRPIVLAGTPVAAEIKRNVAEVKDRFDASVVMTRFSLNGKSNTKEFIGFLKSFIAGYEEYFGYLMEQKGIKAIMVATLGSKRTLASILNYAYRFKDDFDDFDKALDFAFQCAQDESVQENIGLLPFTADQKKLDAVLLNNELVEVK